MIIRRCVLESEQCKILQECHMEDTLQETKQPTKFSNQVFIRQLFLRIVLNG